MSEIGTIKLPKMNQPDAPVVAPAPPVRKLARSQMRTFAVLQGRRQDGVCPLCGNALDFQSKGAVVIDHDHSNGLIRGVLCRACNGAEGKVANAAGRWGARSMEYSKIIAFLERLLVYLRKEPLPIMYPMHKTADEKRLDRNKAAREARARAKARATIKGKV